MRTMLSEDQVDLLVERFQAEGVYETPFCAAISWEFIGVLELVRRGGIFQQSLDRGLGFFNSSTAGPQRV